MCVGLKLLRTMLLASLFSAIAQSAVPKINVYNWSGYLPESLLHEFTQKTGIQVNYSTYDSNETLYAKLKLNPQNKYDIVVPSSYFVERMVREGMLQPIDHSRLTGLKNLDTRLLNKPYDPHNRYSIPYLWNSTGMVINTRYHSPKSLLSWESLWQSSFKGRLLLLEDMREIFSIALLSLGFSPNTQNPMEINQAYLKLRKLIPNVRVFSTEGVASLYIDEDLTLGMGWNGDAYRAHQENRLINYHYPKEGYIISIDSLSIPIGACHVDYAYQFIDFLLQPEVAAKISLMTGYASPNQAAQRYLPASLLSNQMIYPDAETFQLGVIQQDVGVQTSLYEQYWELLKIGA